MATMPSMSVQPIPLALATGAIPLLAGAIGRSFITPKEEIRSQDEANAELRRLGRNFAIFYTLLAAGLGYAAVKTKMPETWKSVVLGGAIGTGLLASALGAGLVFGPSPTPPAPGPVPVGGAMVPFGARPRARLPAGVAVYTGPSWISHVLGYP